MQQILGCNTCVCSPSPCYLVHDVLQVGLDAGLLGLLLFVSEILRHNSGKGSCNAEQAIYKATVNAQYMLF